MFCHNLHCPLYCSNFSEWNNILDVYGKRIIVTTCSIFSFEINSNSFATTTVTLGFNVTKLFFLRHSFWLQNKLESFSLTCFFRLVLYFWVMPELTYWVGHIKVAHSERPETNTLIDKLECLSLARCSCKMRVRPRAYLSISIGVQQV